MGVKPHVMIVMLFIVIELVKVVFTGEMSEECLGRSLVEFG